MGNAMGDGSDKVERPAYSVSALMVYETCPFQYFTAVVLGLPPPVSRAMRKGTSIHKLIADHLKGPKLIPPQAEQSLLAMLETFKSSRFNLSPVAVETPFTLPLDRGDVRGRIDLILPRGDAGLEIVDFKSGSVRDRDELSRSLQLPLYAMAAARRFGRRPEELAYTYYFLRDSREVSFHPNERDFTALGERVAGIMELIEAGRFDPTPGCRCYACVWRGSRSTRRRHTR
jgi:DNA helicase-2/ATP-dependent DNA helicase PcrA